MFPQDIWKAVRRRPFVPFRITLTEGSTYEIKHPEFCIVTTTSVFIGLLPTDDPDPLPQRSVEVDVSHVVKLEPLALPAKGKKS